MLWWGVITWVVGHKRVAASRLGVVYQSRNASNLADAELQRCVASVAPAIAPSSPSHAATAAATAAAATAAEPSQSPQIHLCDRTLVAAAQRLEEAWAWGLDPDLWRAHLGPATWPEVLRQHALASGAGGSRYQLKQQPAAAEVSCWGPVGAALWVGAGMWASRCWGGGGAAGGITYLRSLN